MLIRSTGLLQSDLYLLTLGGSCHYLIGTEAVFSLFDPGLSAHIPMLLKRVNSVGFSLEGLQKIFLSHADADRIGGVPLLKKMRPEISLVGSPLLQSTLKNKTRLKEIYDENEKLSAKFDLGGQLLKMDFEEYYSLLQINSTVVDSDTARVTEDLSLRIIACPGHSPESLAYFVMPYGYLIVDEGFGYYRGQNLASPGGDKDLKAMVHSIERLNDLEINGICFPNTGTITGNLVRKHLQGIVQNTADLISESKKAKESAISEEEILASIKESFYREESGNPLLRANMEKSLIAIWEQVKIELAGQPATN